MTYKIIDENEEQKKYNEVVEKITPESLGLRPTTDFAQYAQQTLIDENPQKVKQWIDEGEIGIMEAGKRFTYEFNGTYENIDNSINLNRIEKALANSGRNKIVAERIENNKRKIEERNERVNNGTASILDRIGAGLDRWGKASYEAQVQYAEQQANAQMPHKDDPNFRYKPVSIDKSGRVIYSETDLRKKIDFSEALADSIGQGKALPFVSGVIEGSSAKKYRDIVERIRNGEAIRQDELDYVNHYIDRKNEEYVRGYTIGGQIGQSILPSLLAFGGEMALGGAILKRIGLAGFGLAGGVNLGKNLLRTGKVGKGIAKGIAFTTGQLAEGGINAAVTSTVNPTRIFATFQERRLNDEMKITDRGTVIFQEATESPAKAFIKSLAQVYVSYFTENMGSLLSAPVKASGKAISSIGAKQFAKVLEKNPALEKLIQRTAPIFAKAYEKLNNLPIKGKSVDWLKSQVKFDGFLEELGEEVLEDVLNLAIGTNNEERTLENYVSKIVKSPEEWAVLAGVIALQGTTLSVAGNTLGDYMHTNGVEFEDIAKVLMNSTEAEKIEYINEAIKRGDIKINEGAIQDNHGIVTNLKNKYYTQIKNAGLEDSEALQTADLFSQIIATTANKFNMSIEDTDRLMGLNIQSMTDEQATSQWQKDNENLKRQMLQQPVESAGAEENEFEAAKKEWEEKGTESKYFKKWFGDSKVVDENGKPLVVYHGTPNQFDEFSYDKIGTNGTVEGVGFYFTDDADTAKGYIKRNGEVKECYLSIKKPLEHDSHFLSFEDIKNIIKKAAELQSEEYEEDLKDSFVSNYADTYSIDFDDAVEETAYMIYSEDKTDTDMLGEIAYSANSEFANRATTLVTGYDGVITNGYGNLGAGGGKFYIPFNPEQIKATENQGTFDENNPNIYFQSAYHGSPHKFEEFSLENIGTGEGNQAHGWGLYFAENKEVSEKYRETLSNYKRNSMRSLDEEYENLLINGKPILENYDIDIDRTVYNFIHAPAVQSSWLNSTKDFLKKKTEEWQDLLKDKDYPFKDYAETKIDAYKRLLNDISNGATIKDKVEGQLFKVDVPEKENLLDEDKKYSEQSKTVQEALKKLYEDNWEKYPNSNHIKLAEIIYTDNTSKKYKNNLSYKEGRYIYEYISGMVGSDKKASELLNKYGVKGITYDGTQDGRCYVIFDDKAINVLKTYYQESNNIENARGFTYERKNFDGTARDNLIVLLKGKANKSTLLHEFAHVYLTTLNNIARENDRAKELLIKVNKFLRYNGKEYTTAQHEKFANSFVAYVKTGKAPTYGLKRVFENFKKWLNDLYSNLQLSDDVELSKEAKDVFDELLGDMTLESQKKVSLEIIEKARNNARLQIWQEEAEKNKVPQNQLTDRQRRYRDTAYSILWYALSHTKNKEGKQLVKDKKQLYMLLGNDSKSNKKNMGVMRQGERLEQILGELDDPFSANDGFLPEWSEFFNNPNVEDGNDSELALMAFDVIKNRKYLYDSENVYEELSNNDVRVAQLELEYILQKYSEEKGDKSNVVVAFFEWIEEQHPYIQEDLIARWELKTNEIDRYQALSKFGQAKEDLKLYAAKLQGHGDYSTQFAEYARAILKRLDFMVERDKEKIFSKLKEYNSFREIERNLDYVMDYAETLQEVSDRRKLAEDIEREVKQTIHEWKDGIKKTKYTYPANKLFERLRKINNMKQEEIQNLYDEQVNEETLPSYVADEVNSETFYETIEKMFVTFKANGSYYNSTEFLTDLLNKIQSAKFTAKVARDELDFERRMQQINLIDECAKAVDNHKFNDKKNKAVKIAEKFNAHIMNLNGALQMIFNENIKNQFSLDYLYAKKDGQVGRDRRAVLDKLKEVFDFKSDRQLFSKFIDMTKPEYEIKQRYTPDIQNGTVHTSDIYDKESGQTKANVQQILPENTYRPEWQDEPIKLSKMEIIYYYIQSKNKISYLMLTDMGDEHTSPKGQFDKFEFDTMIDSLTPEEKLMGNVLQMAAEKYYDGLNAYHIKKYHTDLGKVSCYFPRLSEVEDPRMLDVFNDYVMYNGKDSSQKHRTAYAGIRIKPANAVAVLFNHIEKANTIITMGEQLDLMNRVFNNSNLKKKIESVFGEDVTQSFYQHITANLYSGQTALRSLQEQFFAKIANNAVKTQIFFKPQIGLKQLLSFMNYGKGDEYVSAGEWIKEFSKQTLTPSEWKKNIEFMLENDYLRDRYSRGGSTDALKRQLENRMFSKLSLLDELWGLPIQLGDIGAIIWGGKPYIDVLMKKGYTKEQAFKIFIETTVNDQQSSIPSTLSNAQREAKKQAFSTMMYAYQNTPYQYLRSCYTPIVKALQQGGKQNIKKAAKMFFIYGWLFPAIFNMASTLSIFNFMGGDDEQLKKDMGLAFLGLFGMLPIWGDTLKAIVNGLVGDNYSGGTNYFVSATNKMNKLARHIEKDKVTLEDVWNAIAVVGEMSTGQPIGSMGNAASGIYDITQGDVAKGTLKVLGYSDYRAKTVTGEK